MFNPELQEVVDVAGPDVKDYRALGYMPIGNRPEEEFLCKSRAELAVEWNDEPWEAGEEEAEE